MCVCEQLDASLAQFWRGQNTITHNTLSLLFAGSGGLGIPTERPGRISGGIVLCVCKSFASYAGRTNADCTEWAEGVRVSVSVGVYDCVRVPLGLGKTVQ